MRVRLDRQLRVEATELHRRRVSSGSSYAPKLATVLAQVGLLHAYGRELTVKEIDAWMRVMPADENGTMLNIVTSHRIYDTMVKPGRVHVLAEAGEEEITYKGWITSEAIAEAPVTKDRVDSDAYREIEDVFLAEMPEQFLFEDSCNHLAGTWDHAYDAWHCICGRRVHDQRARELAAGPLRLADPVRA